MGKKQREFSVKKTKWKRRWSFENIFVLVFIKGAAWDFTYESQGYRKAWLQR